jgi:hypothetical protein
MQCKLHNVMLAKKDTSVSNPGKMCKERIFWGLRTNSMRE